MSFKLRKLAINMNVIINMLIIKKYGKNYGDKLQRNRAFSETGKLLHICCPNM